MKKKYFLKNYILFENKNPFYNKKIINLNYKNKKANDENKIDISITILKYCTGEIVGNSD